LSSLLRWKFCVVGIHHNIWVSWTWEMSGEGSFVSKGCSVPLICRGRGSNPAEAVQEISQESELHSQIVSSILWVGSSLHSLTKGFCCCTRDWTQDLKLARQAPSLS
jgi:hypothetical protein